VIGIRNDQIGQRVTIKVTDIKSLRLVVTGRGNGLKRIWTQNSILLKKYAGRVPSTVESQNIRETI